MCVYMCIYTYIYIYIYLYISLSPSLSERKPAKGCSGCARDCCCAMMQFRSKGPFVLYAIDVDEAGLVYGKLCCITAQR